MIGIKIIFTAGKISGFSVTGHSNTAPYGEDIVCAGVSALTQSALMGLAQHLGRKVDYSVHSGNLRVQLLFAPDELSEAILRTMLLGLKAIAEQYEEAVRITMIHEG